MKQSSFTNLCYRLATGSAHLYAQTDLIYNRSSFSSGPFEGKGNKRRSDLSAESLGSLEPSSH